MFGKTGNPWNPALTCGGSTGGGGAALAAGLAPLAQGSDLGGSLRIPAAFCGVVGFRTSPGLVPVWPTELAWDTLSVQGPMARTVGDVALMLSVIAGPDARARTSYPVDVRAFPAAIRGASLRGARIAWSADLGITPVDDEIRRVTTASTTVLRRLGARVEEAQMDWSPLLNVVLVTRGIGMVARHADKLAKWRDVMQDNLVRNIEYGLSLGARDVARAEVGRTVLWRRARDFFERYDYIVTPTTAVPPFPVDTVFPVEIAGRRMDNYIQWLLLTYAFTILGVPAISVPCGFTRDRLPVGLQIAGRWRDDAGVLRAAAAFEAAVPWSDARPPASA